ncbi:hypothetical protein PEDI_37310 [Persicobacter diffluens]|uniref:Uncharacterized protein n=1 Tax=Persicobacter diffluens TaxID=981 RepID=A0AAN4VZX9_9BACT|nr:hypothetical protein PEDI_37310 [Persicobacter diffluens]
MLDEFNNICLQKKKVGVILAIFFKTTIVAGSDSGYFATFVF